MEQKEYKIFDVIDILLNENFDEAKKACDQLIVKFPNSGRLYIYRIMAELGAQYPEDLVDIGEDITTYPDYEKALPLLSEQDRKDLDYLVEQIKAQNDEYVEDEEEPSEEESDDENEIEGEVVENPEDRYDSAFYSNGKVYLNNQPISSEDYDDYDILHNDDFLMIPLDDMDDRHLIVDLKTGTSFEKKLTEGFGTYNGVDLDDLYSDLI